MSDLLATLGPAIRALSWVDAVFFWSLTLATVIGGECYFARYGTRGRRYYKRIFDRLHWLVAFGPFALFFVLASYLDGKSWEGTMIVLGILAFFATVHMLERVHEAAWRIIQPSPERDS